MRSTAKLSSASESIQLGEINLGRPKFKFDVAYAKYGWVKFSVWINSAGRN